MKEKFEIWKIVSINPNYAVSNYGKVKRLGNKRLEEKNE